MSLDFEKYAMKGNEFMNLLAKKLGDESDRARASRILRSTFRVLRDHLTVEESVHLLSQLPMALKSVYVEGWKVSHARAPRIRTLEEFVAEILKADENAAWRDFSSIQEVIFSVKAVIETISRYVSPHELEEAFGTLSEELKEVFRSWIPFQSTSSNLN